jgi:hypothetical protein
MANAAYMLGYSASYGIVASFANYASTVLKIETHFSALPEWAKKAALTATNTVAASSILTLFPVHKGFVLSGGNSVLITNLLMIPAAAVIFCIGTYEFWESFVGKWTTDPDMVRTVCQAIYASVGSLATYLGLYATTMVHSSLGS